MKPILSHTANVIENKVLLRSSSAYPYLTYSEHLRDSFKNYLLDINDKINISPFFHEMYLVFEKKNNKYKQVYFS